jgi:tRNA pseudouridine32 synthase / 23S rRNA pseudouridine746 synthase
VLSVHARAFGRPYSVRNDRNRLEIEGAVAAFAWSAAVQCVRPPRARAPAQRRNGLTNLPTVGAAAHVRPGSSVRLPAGQWPTVLDCLCTHFAAISREQWLSRIRRGLVRDRQGRPLTAGTPYRAGLEVLYFRELAAETPIPFAESVVWADADLVVADKPHFLPVAPTGSWVEETLLVRLMRRLDNPLLVPLHRIDRATAGLVLFSVNPATRARYQALFRERRITKTYEAIAPALAEHAFPLLRCSRLVPGEPFFRMREGVGRANSETRIAVLQRGVAHWRYELVPVTGRKHQLRVHMAALGAPIANDSYYPELLPAAADDYSRPLALLARTLEFVDPLCGSTRRFSSGRQLQGPDQPLRPIPPDMPPEVV